MAQRVTRSYWLGGDQHCPLCHLAYALAVQRHCSVCDGPACPHCVTAVEATREVVCRECEQANDRENGERE